MTGLVVLITGGASGIGAATAAALTAKGAIPVLVDCDAERLKCTAAAMSATYFCADVSPWLLVKHWWSKQ